MMKAFVKFTILTGLFLCLSGKIFAQVYIVLDDQKEINQCVDSTEAKIIILSPVKDLKITHSAGKETGIYIRQKNGMYLYELNHVFDANDLKDGFCKTNMEIKSSNASSGSIPLNLYPGMCSQWTYDEKPRTLSFQNESKELEIYPLDNKALLSFISKISDLTIQVGENTVVKDGKEKENASSIDVNIKKEDSHTNYELVFHTNVEEFNSLPKIFIEDSSHERLDVPLGEQIAAKGTYRVRITKKSAQETKILNSSSALGIGNGITCGLIGIYSRYRFGKYFGIEAGIGLSDFDNKFMHLSAGAKYYPYQSWALSIHYGNVFVEKTDSYNSENGEFGIEGIKHLAGWSFLAGYDGSLPLTGAFRKININTGIGFSYTKHISLAWNIGIGFNF